jgi:hypothetical protein
MLRVAAFGGPVRERVQAVAVLPGKLEKLAGIQIRGFWAEESLEAPLDVGAIPGMKPVAAGGEPVELEEAPHGKSIQLSVISSQFKTKTDFIGWIIVAGGCSQKLNFGGCTDRTGLSLLSACVADHESNKELHTDHFCLQN